MSKMKICVLAVAAAFAAPAVAQKAIEQPVGAVKIVAPKATLQPIAPVSAPKTAPASASAPAAAIGKPQVTPTAVVKNPAGAAISTANMKLNIDMKGLSEQSNKGGLQDVKSRMMGMGGEGGRQAMPGLLGDSEAPKSAGAALKDEFKAGPVKGQRADTFGGQRINNKQGGGGGKNNFAGGKGGGKASSGGGDDDTAKTITTMLEGEGGKSTGSAEGDANELAYAMSVGTDGYAATKNMSQAERKSYWEGERNKQLIGSGRPREDDMGSGGGPATRQDVVTQNRGISARTGGAGGAGDGRTDQQSGGGSNGQMIERGKAEGAQREGGGTINLDAVLKINTLVNPGAQ